MSERVILAVKFTPAGPPGLVRQAVGGFLRYVQHRDFHPTEAKRGSRPEVSGLLKYVAHRDRAASRAELFGPTGALGSAGRRAFASFVAGALERSRPQLFRNREGELSDRRRAVYRMVISPERAGGLNLERLTRAAVARLQREAGGELRWIAAIHRNTAHHHVHLVVAGLREDADCGFTRVDITKPRLAAMKQALVMEIERQRGERTRTEDLARVEVPLARSGSIDEPFVSPRLEVLGLRGKRAGHRLHPTSHGSAVIALRSLARRYQRQMERELETSYRLHGLERAA